MPFDGKNFTETKPGIFTLDGLIAWLEKRAPNARYNYWCDHCLIGQYFRDHGMPIDTMGAGSYNYVGEPLGTRKLPPKFDDVAVGGPWTYGAALDRAIALRRAEEARRG